MCRHKNLDRIELLPEVLQEITECNFDLPRERETKNERNTLVDRRRGQSVAGLNEPQREGGALA